MTTPTTANSVTTGSARTNPATTRSTTTPSPPVNRFPSGLLSSRLHGSARNESGYVLGVVLAAMTVGLLLITALLSLSFATHRAAITQQRLAAEQRAVDGALETSLTRVREDYNDPANFDLCGPFEGSPPEIDQIDFDAGTAQSADDTTVRVECEEVLGSGAPASGTVQLVGEDYADVAGGTNWAGWDWASALGSIAAPGAALAPTLVHNADGPLRFNGSVAVRSGTAALLKQPGASGALDIQGNYLQGAAGHPGTGSQCGMLLLGSPEVPDGDLSRTAVVDSDATPVCGDETSHLEATEVVDGPTGWPGSAVPSSCPASGTVTFSPGDYDAADTAALNALFDGTCSKLYHFDPGDYWFDVGGADNALVFDDASSAFVFGTLQGTGATAVCDPAAADGAKVVLSGRSTIRHVAGNVSICADGGEGDALVQSQQLPSSITVVNPVSGTHCFRFPCWAADKRADFVPVSEVTAPASGSSDAVGKVDCFPVDVCYLRFTVDLHANSDRAMSSLEVAWTSSESPPAHLSDRKVTVKIDKGGSNLCSVNNERAGRTPGFITAVDLTSCAALAGQPESVLEGAKMTVIFSFRDFFGGETIKLNLRGLHMRVNAREIDATEATSAVTTASSPSEAWPGVDPAVLGAGGGASTYPDPGSCGSFPQPPGICDRTSAGATEAQPLTLGAFDPTAAGFDPQEDLISSLLLAVDNQNGDNQVAAPIGGANRGETRVRVTWSGGTCDVPWQPINTYTRSSRTYYIDILSGDATSCSVLADQPMSVLETATVALSIRPERGMWIGGTPYYNLGLELPKLDHVRLVATSETTEQLKRALVTNDVGNNTRFRVHGDVTMPRTSMDIDWTGAVETDPIVNGSMQLHSLGSTAADGVAVGIVCCGSGSRETELVAEVQEGGDWVPRGTARATLTKAPAEPLADATVTGWQFCGGEGCPPSSAGGLGPPP